jgi:hypothetical protein
VLTAPALGDIAAIIGLAILVAAAAAWLTGSWLKTMFLEIALCVAFVLLLWVMVAKKQCGAVLPTIPCYHPKMDVDHYRENIVATNQQIVDAKADIARQRKIIEDLNWSGRETDLAESMLETLEGCLRALEHHREVLMDCLRNAERKSVKL